MIYWKKNFCLTCIWRRLLFTWEMFWKKELQKFRPIHVIVFVNEIIIEQNRTNFVIRIYQTKKECFCVLLFEWAKKAAVWRFLFGFVQSTNAKKKREIPEIRLCSFPETIPSAFRWKTNRQSFDSIKCFPVPTFVRYNFFLKKKFFFEKNSFVFFFFALCFLFSHWLWSDVDMFSICFAPKSHLFIFFFSSCAQKEDVYNAVAHDASSDVLNGFNATVFAYGQTGAGKVRAKQKEAKIIFLKYHRVLQCLEVEVKIWLESFLVLPSTFLITCNRNRLFWLILFDRFQILFWILSVRVQRKRENGL